MGAFARGAQAGHWRAVRVLRMARSSDTADHSGSEVRRAACMACGGWPLNGKGLCPRPPVAPCTWLHAAACRAPVSHRECARTPHAPAVRQLTGI